MKFDFSKYQGKYAMHCKTEEEAKDFCRVMHEDGRSWIDGILYTKITNWSGYKEKTVYCFNEGKFDTLLSAKNDDYTILEWEDFMEKEFTKADLKDGMVIICANGERYIFLCEGLRNSDMRGWFGGLECIDEDFKNVGAGGNGFDFVCICTSSAQVLCEWCDDKYLTPVWQRPEEVTEMTVTEIKEALGIDGTLKIKEG